MTKTRTTMWATALVVGSIVPATVLAQRHAPARDAGTAPAGPDAGMVRTGTAATIPPVTFGSNHITTGGTGGAVHTGTVDDTPRTPVAATLQAPDTPEETGESPPENPVDVVNLLRSRRPQYQPCYTAAVHANPQAGSGRLAVRFTLGADGHIVQPAVTGMPAAPTMASCVATALGTLAFPRPVHGAIYVDTTLTFTPTAARPLPAHASNGHHHGH